MLDADLCTNVTGGLLDTVFVDARHHDVQFLLVVAAAVVVAVGDVDVRKRRRSFVLGLLLRSASEDVLQLLFLVGHANGGREDQKEAQSQILQRPIHVALLSYVIMFGLKRKSIRIYTRPREKGQKARNEGLFTEGTASKNC